jgi:hypothetical protein
MPKNTPSEDKSMASEGETIWPFVTKASPK